MSAEEIQKQADIKRNNAKRLANMLFKIPAGCSSGAVEQMVDDIIAAAMLELAAVQAEAATEAGVK